MSFRELQRLAGGAFQDRFSIVPQAFGFALEINFGGGLPAYHQQITVCSQEYLATTWNRLVGDVLDPGRAREDRQRLFRQHEAQLMRDLPRTTYSIDGDRLDFAAPEGGKPNDPQLMLQIFRGVLLSGGTVTERQHTAVEVLASQGVFADVAASAMKHNGGKFDATEAANMMVGPEIELRLDITRSGDDIILHGKNVKGDISLPDGDVLKTSPMMLSKVTEFTLAIAPDGRVNVLSASFCGPAEA